MSLALQLYQDEGGFIVSAELVLIATIAVLGMLVGLSEVALNVNNELEDVGSAFGSINQSFAYYGLRGHGGHIVGSKFEDQRDYCDGQHDITCDQPAVPESPKHGHK